MSILSSMYSKMGLSRIGIFVLGTPFLICSGVANAKELKVSITSNYAPYHFIDKDGKSGGIHYDIISEINAELGYTTIMRTIPRKRMEKRALENVDDCFPNALAWTSNIEKFVYSEPISEVQDVLFTVMGSALKFTEPADLFGKRIIAMRGYVYPILDPHFKSQKISKTETGNELAALKMLNSRRGDAAIIVKNVGQWLIKENNFPSEFRFAEVPITSEKFRLVCNKKMVEFIPKFNAALRKMEKNGKIKEILAKYSAK